MNQRHSPGRHAVPRPLRTAERQELRRRSRQVRGLSAVAVLTVVSAALALASPTISSAAFGTSSSVSATSPWFSDGEPTAEAEATKTRAARKAAREARKAAREAARAATTAPAPPADEAAPAPAVPAPAVEDPATASTTSATGGSSDFDFGADASYLDTLPTSGAAWDRVKAQADAPYDLLIGDGATDGSGNAFAGGLVWQRTGDAAYRDKVNAALDQVEATDPAGWWHAAANRKMIGWALAGQLVDRPVKGADGSLTSWGTFLSEQLTVTHGGPGRSGVMADAAAGWDNNHGSAARQSEAAIRAVLDLPLTDQCDNAKAWLGGGHAGQGFVASTSPTSDAMGITDASFSSTWQHDPAKPYGVVPSSAWAGETVDPRKAGAIPSDVIRDGGSFPNIGGSASHYVFGNGHRMTNALTVLAANGCVLWDYADRAAMRWRVWAMDNGLQQPEGANNEHGDVILNAVYGTDFPAVGTRGGEGIVGGDWLASGGQWPAGA